MTWFLRRSAMEWHAAQAQAPHAVAPLRAPSGSFAERMLFHNMHSRCHTSDTSHAIRRQTEGWRRRGQPLHITVHTRHAEFYRHGTTFHSSKFHNQAHSVFFRPAPTLSCLCAVQALELLKLSPTGVSRIFTGREWPAGRYLSTLMSAAAIVSSHRRSRVARFAASTALATA